MDRYDVLMNLKRQGTTGSTSVATTSRVPPSTTAPAPPTTSNASSSSTVSTPSSTSPTAAPTTSTPPGTNTGTTPIVTRSSSAANTTPTQEASTAPTSTPAPATSSTPAPTSRTTTPPTSTPVSTSSAAPTTTTTPPTSSAAPTSSSTPPTSTPVSTSSSTPVTTSTPVTSSTATTATTPTSTSVQLTPTVIPIGTSSRTTLSVPLTTSFIRTTSAGVVYTVTAIVGQPSASASSAAAKKPFFQNTGAVVGVFVVVGVAATALAVFIITLFIRRRRAKAFDREVQDAARDAALTHAPVDDDDYTGNASYNTHASQPMSTERDHRSGYSGGPGGGYGSSNASSWDPYGRTAAGAVAGYEMHQRRTSTGTAPGMAGFGAGDAFARNVGADGYNQSQPQPQGYGPGYGQPQQQQAYNNQGYNNQQQQQGNRSYNNTSPPQTYQLAQERGPTRAAPQPKMMMPEVQQQQRQNYNTVDAYRPGPSYGQAHPGEQVEYGHAYGGEDLDRPRQSEDPYTGYEGYEYGSNSNHAGGSNAGLPAYAPGPSGAATAGATGDRKGAAASIGANLMRQPSAATQYSQDTDGSVDERPQKRVLKVANE